MRTRTLTDPRPSTVPVGADIYQTCPLAAGDALPSNWQICTAPRPIFGHVLWRDGGGHGSFYAAVDPSDGETSTWMMKRNIQNDATLLSYITQEEAIERQRAYYQENMPFLLARNGYLFNDPAKQAMIADTYLRRVNQA